MSIFEKIRFQQEKEFASILAARLAKEISPELMQNKRKLLSVNKITRLLEKSFSSANEYQKINQMGWLKRTVFANAFQWELKNLNFPNDFVTMATEGLIIQLMKPSKPSGD